MNKAIYFVPVYGAAYVKAESLEQACDLVRVAGLNFGPCGGLYVSKENTRIVQNAEMLENIEVPEDCGVFAVTEPGDVRADVEYEYRSGEENPHE